MIGLALALLAGELLSAWCTAGLGHALALAAVWVLARRLGVSDRIAAPAGWMASAALGIALATRAAEPPRSSCFLPAADPPTKLWVEARVEDAPTRGEDAIRFPASVRTTGSDGSAVCGRVLLTIPSPTVSPHAGDRLRLHATLRRPRNFANPGAYDQAGALARRQIWVTGYASGADMSRVGADEAPWLPRERERIGALIDESLPAEDASLLRALVVGDEGSVGAEMWEAIAKSGVAHVLSVSGMHIAVVWGLVFALVRWLLARSEWLLLHAHVRAVAAVVALLPAAAYGALAGLSAPAARSVLMTGLCVTSLAADREVTPLRVLCLAAMAIALARPGEPLDVSFQLSFVSVLSLVLAGEAWSHHRPATRDDGWRRRVGHGVALGFAVPAAALLGTAPLVASHFHRLTPIGILSNPLLVPLTATPATILGLAGAAVSELSETGARATFALARWPLDGFRWGVALAAAAPYGSIRVVGPTLVEIAIGYLLLVLPWIPKRARRRVALVASLALALDAGAWWHERARRDTLRVRFLDVGQGDAAVIEAPGGRVLVIDGGGFARAKFDVGERVVAPYLWSRKIARVDAIVASHGDWDHQGGLHFVAGAFAPRELWTVRLPAERKRLAALEKTAVDAGATVRALAAGDTIDLGDGVSIDCLNPPDAGERSANDSSLVLRIRFGRTTFLFTGDVESSAERTVARPDDTEPITVLKVPHHGSDTSSGERFLGWAMPRVAVISLAAGNHYGFPSGAVLRRYRRIGAQIVRTDTDGSVWIESDGEAIEVRPFARSSRALCSFFGALC